MNFIRTLLFLPHGTQGGRLWLGIGWMLWFSVAPLQAAELRIAAASNLQPLWPALERAFAPQQAFRVLVSFNSTGKLYAQIKAGAPFEVFMAADAETPTRLEQEGLTLAKTRYAYAIGQLVLWSARPEAPVANAQILQDGSFQRLALANPQTAPYGIAAQQVLEYLKLWDALQGKLVRGENISQAFQFVESGHAEIGLLSLAQLQPSSLPGAWWLIPQAWYAPLDQQIVVLKPAAESPLASLWLEFILSERARDIFQQYGYRLPNL